MHLSIVIPAFNEEPRIEETLQQVTDYLSSQTYDAEIIVVDDGSTDGTVSVVQTIFPKVRIVSYDQNRGKGYAVKEGMLAATGDYRLFYDADGSTPIEESEKLWPLFEAGADVVIGSRSLPESDVQRHQPWYREKMGRVFNLILKLLALTHFPDTQCGFKAFTSEATATLFTAQTIEHFSFDAELLYIAQRKGLRVEQIPVQWINCPHTRVSAMTDSFCMFLDIVVIRLNAWRGKYS